MRGRTLVLAAVVVLLSGCMGDDSRLVYEFTHNGSFTPSDVNRTFDVSGGELRLSSSWGGTGSARVVITDAKGETVYSRTYDGLGQAESVGETLRGKDGTWGIQMDFTNWSGGFVIQLVQP